MATIWPERIAAKAPTSVAGRFSTTGPLAVNVVNDPPTATDDTGTTNEDAAVTINVLANDVDPDGDPLAVSSVAAPANGTATGWSTLLRKVTLGNIEMTSVPATIMPDLGQEALLGMSFLKRLTLIQRGDELLIRQE